MKRVFLSAVLFAGVVHAQALTTTSSFTSDLSTTDIQKSGLLSLFDTQLGTLTGAVLTINGAIDSTLTMTSRSTGPVSAMVSFSSSLGFGSDLAPVGAVFNGDDDLMLALTTGRQTLASGASFTTGTTLAASATTASYDLGSVLSSLGAAGGGSFGVSCDSVSGILIQGGGGQIAVTQATQALCGASISYTYDAFTPMSPVPEAGSTTLMSFGLFSLASLAAFRRRKPHTASHSG